MDELSVAQDCIDRAVAKLINIYPTQPGVHTENGLVFGFRTPVDKRLADKLDKCLIKLEEVCNILEDIEEGKVV